VLRRRWPARPTVYCRFPAYSGCSRNSSCQRVGSTSTLWPAATVGSLVVVTPPDHQRWPPLSTRRLCRGPLHTSKVTIASASLRPSQALAHRVPPTPPKWVAREPPQRADASRCPAPPGQLCEWERPRLRRRGRDPAPVRGPAVVAAARPDPTACGGRVKDASRSFGPACGPSLTRPPPVGRGHPPPPGVEARPPGRDQRRFRGESFGIASDEGSCFELPAWQMAWLSVLAWWL
jgi:hypothetical protein